MLVNVKKRLREWRDQGLITENEYQRMLTAEDARDSRSWPIFGVAGIGAFIFIAGVLSTIASNWELLGDAAKILGYFVLQIGFGILFLRYERTPGATREISLTVFAWLIWAGISLIGKTHNLSLAPEHAMLLGTALTLPAALYSNSLLLCSMWCLSAVMAGAFWQPWHSSGLSNDASFEAFTSTCVLLTAFGMASHSVGLIRQPLRTASIVWGIGLMLLVITPLCNLLWKYDATTWFGLLPTLQSSALPWGAIILAVIASLSRSNVPPPVKKLTALLFVAFGIYITIPVAIPQVHALPNRGGTICGAAGLVAVWSIAAAAAAAASMRRLFNIASFVIAVRFVVAYFEALGSRSLTGIGLIVSGLVILGVGIAWERGRQRMASKIGGAA